MKFVIFRPMIEVNSYPTLQDKQNAVKQFLNRMLKSPGGHVLS